MNNNASKQSAPDREIRFQVVDGGYPEHLGYFASYDEAEQAIESGRYGNFSESAYAVEAED